LAALEGSPALQEALLAPLRCMTELQARPADPGWPRFRGTFYRSKME